MPLSVGAKLGPYGSLAPIGAGGMGEVWEARDTRLHRTVASKTSQAKFSARFEREARAIAAVNVLNDPRIFKWVQRVYTTPMGRPGRKSHTTTTLTGHARRELHL